MPMLRSPSLAEPNLSICAIRQPSKPAQEAIDPVEAMIKMTLFLNVKELMCFHAGCTCEGTNLVCFASQPTQQLCPSVQ